MITVQHSIGDEWVVSIEAESNTRHRVRVSQKDIARLAQGKSAEELIRESFRFLLEREPNTSILSSFELTLIGQYFPEYEQEIKARLAQIT